MNGVKKEKEAFAFIEGGQFFYDDTHLHLAVDMSCNKRTGKVSRRIWRPSMRTVKKWKQQIQDIVNNDQQTENLQVGKYMLRFDQSLDAVIAPIISKFFEGYEIMYEFFHVRIFQITEKGTLLSGVRGSEFWRYQLMTNHQFKMGGGETTI